MIVENPPNNRISQGIGEDATMQLTISKVDITPPQPVPVGPIKRIPVNTAEPPPEVVQLMQQQGLTGEKIEGWLAVPSIHLQGERDGLKEIQNRPVDAIQVLKPLLGNSILDQTLRTVDVINGCGRQCGSCLADAACPSRMFSFDSIKRLFDDERFIRMLQPDSLRFGSSGDLLEHPKALDILKVALEKTKPLDESRRNGGKRHVIKVYTNYRQKDEQKLDELLELARQHPDRLSVIISLPFNVTDTVDMQFAQYAQQRPNIFKGTVNEDGFFYTDDIYNLAGDLPNIRIQDVRHTSVFFKQGRILSDRVNNGRLSKDLVIDTLVQDIEHRGFVKTYFNPDTLWLTIYTTEYESHTHRAYTPLTPENVDTLNLLPYHPDFPTPPNWMGGKGEDKPFDDILFIRDGLQQLGRPKKQLNVVD